MLDTFDWLYFQNRQNRIHLTHCQFLLTMKRYEYYLQLINSVWHIYWYILRTASFSGVWIFLLHHSSLKSRNLAYESQIKHSKSCLFIFIVEENMFPFFVCAKMVRMTVKDKRYTARTPRNNYNPIRCKVAIQIFSLIKQNKMSLCKLCSYRLRCIITILCVLILVLDLGVNQELTKVWWTYVRMDGQG